MNKWSRYIQIFFVCFLACSIWLVGRNFNKKHDNNLFKLEEKLTQVNNEEIVNLDEVANFEWDNVYIFEPYYPKSSIYKTIGYKWDNISDDVSDGMNKVVFMKNGKVVCYIDGKQEHKEYTISVKDDEYRDGVAEIKNNKQKKFKVEKDETGIYLKGL